MKAVLLAAGKGTRLGKITEDKPKPMVPVCGRPVIEYILEDIKHSGIKDYVFVTKYLSNKIEEYFGTGSDHGVRIEYVEQGDDYGTGAALLCAKALVSGSDVFMTFGDVITSRDTYKGAIDTFRDNDCDAVITLNWVDDPYRGAAVITDDSGRVKDVIEKPEKGTVPSHWNSAGVFVFKPVIFDYLGRLSPSDRGEYELPDAMNAMLADGLTIQSYKMNGTWKDVGTARDIEEAEKIIAARQGN